MPLYLGYDVGTTRTKVVLLDARAGRAVAGASLPTPVLRGEQDDERDADAVLEVLAELTRELASAVDLSAVAAVAVASLGEEVVLLDAAGAAIGPTPTWYAIDDETVTAFPDGPAHREASFYKLASVARRRPAILAAAASFTDLGSYLELRMIADAGRPVFMDLSHASRTALLHPGSPAWSRERLWATGAATLQLPALVPSGTTVGAVGNPEFLRAGVPSSAAVVSGGHDHFCGAFGAGIRQSGDAYVSVGTSESQLVIVDQLPETEFDDAECGYYVDATHGYVHRSMPSGRSFAGILERHRWAGDMDALYAALRDRADGGVSDGHTPLMDDLLDELRRQAAASAAGLLRLQELSGTPIRRIVVGGSPAKYALWREIREEAAHLPLEFAPEVELSAAGAALMAEQAARQNGSTGRV
jgi:xylulokinase